MKKEFSALDVWEAGGTGVIFRMEQLVRGELSARETLLNIRGIYDLMLDLDIISGCEYMHLMDELRNQIARVQDGSGYNFRFLPKCTEK